MPWGDELASKINTGKLLFWVVATSVALTWAASLTFNRLLETPRKVDRLEVRVTKIEDQMSKVDEVYRLTWCHMQGYTMDQCQTQKPPEINAKELRNH